MSFTMDQIKDVGGIKPEQFEAPVEGALKRYSRASHGLINFDMTTASRVYLTPDRGYSARSASYVTYGLNQDVIGKLFVYALHHGDGTGDNSTFRLEDLDTGELPRSHRVLPKSKTGINTEVALPLAVYDTRDPHTSPPLFLNSLALLSKAGSQVIKTADIGQHPDELEAELAKRAEGKPEVIRILGTEDGDGGHRLADARAIYNAMPNTVQVVGLIDISNEAISNHPKLLDDLHIQEPLEA